MNVMNLTPGLEIFNDAEETLFIIDYNYSVFPGGEPHITIKQEQSISVFGILNIVTRISNMADLGKLMVAVDAVKRTGLFGDLVLTLPYFPGGRQDRVNTIGEPLTVKVYADVINAMGFEEVIILDPHSDVTAALVEKCNIVTNHAFVEQALTPLELSPWFNLVSPDAGANKKVHKLARALGYDIILKCDKHRDTATGKLSGFEVYSGDLGGQDCVIVDDICDGGGTFLGLAKALKEKNAGNLHLIVTHGIFSKGTEHLLEVFSSVTTTDSWDQSENVGVDVIPLKEIL